MVVKYFKFAALTIVTLLPILFIPGINYARNFVFGSYMQPVTWYPKYKYPEMSDSLKFNIIGDGYLYTGNALDSIKEAHLKVIIQNCEMGDYPCYYSSGHYTVWEAEGELPEYHFTLTHNHGIGSAVYDNAASNLYAWKVDKNLPGSLPSIIQEGPGYRQEMPVNDNSSDRNYTVEYRMRLDEVVTDSTQWDDPVAVLIVRRDSATDTLGAIDTVRVRDFSEGISEPDTLYHSFILKYEPVAVYLLNLEIYWMAAHNLLIDKVTVYDDRGFELFNNPSAAESIKAYVRQSWVDMTVYRWYLKDEATFSVDCFMPYRFVDSLLAEVNQERRAVTCVFLRDDRYPSDPNMIAEFVKRTNPRQVNIENYVLNGHNDCGNTYAPLYYTTHSGEGYWPPDSMGLQISLDGFTHTLEELNQSIDINSIDLWVSVQAFRWRWCCGWVRRTPTPEELRCMSNLALIYGAKGILYWVYFSTDTVSGGGPCPDSTIIQWHGLVNWYGYEKTENWYEIKNNIGPFIDKLGDTFCSLKWQGACSDDIVRYLVLRNGQPSYLDSIRSPGHEPHWVQVGFFENQTADTSYFMLVNRECLVTEGDSFDVFVNKSGGYYRIRDMYSDSIVGIVKGKGDYFKAYLGPGEGKLLRLEKVVSGDVNGGGGRSITDVVYLITYLFKGGPPPKCPPQPYLSCADVNCDGLVNVTDVIYLINYLFKFGPPPGC
ncbi:MAG TPA: dockerin type I domain-containing protein [candidate division Zixibacteria bacterium]